MMGFKRLNRARVIIIFNECTINGTGDLSIENEIEIEGETPGDQRPLIIRTPADALTRILRPLLVVGLGALGAATKADVEGLVERTAKLEG